MLASWTEFVSANDEAPSPERYGHSLTTFNYDDILVVCFGGTSGAGVTSQVDTVWSWTVGKGWHQVSTSGPSPAHRAWHGAAAHGTCLYIFGGNRWEAQPGQKPTRSVHGDLWALDTESWTWRQVVQSSSELWPTARSAMGMAAHGDGLLLYGGRGVGTGFLGDLWMYSTTSGRWVEVTPSPRLKSPIPRVLATFVSTPFGVFLYGGARQVAATPNARAPLCDLWQLKLDDSKGSAEQPVYAWEDCNKVPMCAVEHTVGPDDGSSQPPANTAAGERVVVGHDAHASAFVEPSHLVVWSGVLGRMPKRGVLASAPPPPQLTGNLFSIDLAAIDRGWSMVPAARLNAGDSAVGPVQPRRWAAMSALGPGRAVVHGGLAEQRVLGQAAVLEVQEAAITSPRGTTISGGSENATAAAQTADLLSLDTGAVSPANQDPFSITSPGASGPGDGTQLAKLPSPGRESPALGPLKSSSVMSAVLGGVRRGMESFSSEAANVIQRVTNTGKQEGEADDAYMAPGQVRYSQPPAASTSAGAGPQRAAGTPVLSRDFIEGWLRANSSAAESSVKVLVATTDRLTKPRLSQKPAAQNTAAAAPSEDCSTPGSSPSEASQATDQTDNNPSSDDPTTAPTTPLTVLTGPGGVSEEEGDVDSPVSLWISPSPTGPHSPLSVDQSSSAAFGSSRPELQAADVDAHAVVDIMEELLDRVADSGAQQACSSMRRDGSGEEDFQFDKLPNASVPAVPSVWPLGPPDGPQQPGARVETGAKEQGSPDKDVPTAYVQDMLTTDPVHELGLRVTRLSSSTLEFVSLSEAKTELRRAACAWLLSVPCAECLRRKDVDALWTEYRRAAPNAMTQFGKNSGQKLGTLMHLARKDLRMRDIPKLLHEFKQLRKLASAKSRPG